MSNSKIKNIYYLGPDGSNAHRAMRQYIFNKKLNIKNFFPQKSIKNAFLSLVQDKNALCVLPIENSIEGIVRETIDNLVKLKDEAIKIQGEITLDINHLLLAKTNEISKIKTIISHPQALAQCSNFLHENFPNAELKEVSSTSYAAIEVSNSDDETLAAIANETCAEIFGLKIIADNLNDEKDNKTRFYVLSANNFNKYGDGKTSIILSTKNTSGALCNVLKIFQKHEINLSYIDSRPSKKALGEYLFFMEIDGYKDEPHVKDALSEVTSFVNFIRILGTFPKY